MSRSIFGRSFGHAVRGLGIAFHSEASFRWQLLSAALVLGLAWILPLDGLRRWLLAFVVLLVLVLELINSSLERLVDLAKPRLHDLAREVKDVMAGAVLLVALFSVAVGFWAFGPYLFNLLFVTLPSNV